MSIALCWIHRAGQAWPQGFGYSAELRKSLPSVRSLHQASGCQQRCRWHVGTTMSAAVMCKARTRAGPL